MFVLEHGLDPLEEVSESGWVESLGVGFEEPVSHGQAGWILAEAYRSFTNSGRQTKVGY